MEEDPRGRPFVPEDGWATVKAPWTAGVVVTGGTEVPETEEGEAEG